MASLRKRRCCSWLLSVLGVGLLAQIIGSAFGPSAVSDLLGIGFVLLLLAVCGYLLWVEFLQPLTMNGECPVCHRRGIRHIARSTSFFQCVYCDVRLQRSSPVSEWEDASTAEADELFRTKSEAGHWTEYAEPDPSATTSGQLLRSKRSRDTARVIDQPLTGDPVWEAADEEAEHPPET